MDHIPTHYLGQKIVVHQIEKNHQRFIKGVFGKKIGQKFLFIFLEKFPAKHVMLTVSLF